MMGMRSAATTVTRAALVLPRFIETLLAVSPSARE